MQPFQLATGASKYVFEWIHAIISFT